MQATNLYNSLSGIFLILYVTFSFNHELIQTVKTIAETAYFFHIILL